MLLGGRAAEALLIGSVSTGAQDDLVRATDVARSMVMRYGMDPALGHIAYERERAAFLPVPDALPQPSRAYSEATAQEIDSAVKRLTSAAFARATELLATRRAVLEDGSRELLARETLDEADLARIVQSAP
jgi:cell division protease FtsH